MIRIARWIISWIIRNATLKVYTSPDPYGRKLGGHDIIQLRDFYLILDIRVATRVLLFGYFQFT